MDAQLSLMELLEGLHDPRGAQGKRHPLPALLGLAVVGMLAGMTSYEAIAQYGKERGWDFLRHLGFTTRKGLCKATYSRVFRRIDVADFEARVGRWIAARLGRGDATHLAIDGKAARGGRDGGTPGVHLVAAYAPTSRRSWPNSGATPRPTSTRPRRGSWGSSRWRARSSPATPCSPTATSARR